MALSSADTMTALVMQESVTFTAQTQSRDVTVLGVAEGMTTVTAIADALANSGLTAEFDRGTCGVGGDSCAGCGGAGDVAVGVWADVA